MTERISIAHLRAELAHGSRPKKRAGTPVVPTPTAPTPDDPVMIVLSGVPEPYRERQRAFQSDKDGQPLTYSYKPGSVRHYQNWLRDAAMKAMAGRAPFDCALTLTMSMFMPIPSTLRKAERLLAEQELLPVTKRPDTTQLLKTAEDALTKVVWTDDARVSRHVLERLYSPRPRLEITVAPWQPERP